MEIVLIIIAITLSLEVLLLSSNNKNSDKMLELIKIENILLKNKIRQLEYENNDLRIYKIYTQSYKTGFKANFNDDVKEAVKYAMKKAHPDNGGSTEDFNKFRELYNKLK